MPKVQNYKKLFVFCNPGLDFPLGLLVFSLGRKSGTDVETVWKFKFLFWNCSQEHLYFNVSWYS